MQRSNKVLLPKKTALASAPRRRLLQLAAIGAAAALLPSCNDKKAVVGPVQGDRFPDVALRDLDGRTSPFSVYSNVALIVNFWATWCEPCRREMPGLEKLSTLFRPGDLQVIGVTVDNDVNLAREFGLRLKLTFPLMSDSNQTLSNKALRITGFPTTYLLKRDHSIASIIVGAREWAEPKMIEEIEQQLAVRRLAAV